MRLILQPVKTDNLEIYVQESTVVVKGNIDMQFPKYQLGPFFENLHNEVTRHGFKFITLDLTGLAFINSSGIRELLAWIIKIPRLEQQNRYEIYLKINPEIPCQAAISKSFSLIYTGIKTVK